MAEGKIAIITGAAGGLGLAFTEALLERGAKVCICDVDVEKGQTTEEQLQRRFGKERIFFKKCDVTSETEFEDVFKDTVERFGHPDILCNNAGISDESDWKLMIAVNLAGVIHGTQLGFRYMGTTVGKDDGHIINIGSAAGVLPMPFGSIYAGTKHAVVGYTRSIGVIARRLYGVRVNCLCPSFTDTAIMTPVDQDVKDMPKDEQPMNVSMVSAVGVMQPRDVADGFMQLVEADARTSAGVMLVTPSGKSLLALPKTIPQMFAKHSNL